MGGYLANKLTDPFNLGWFATEAALNSAYPTGADGYFAMIGTTDTFWAWDSDTAAWVDTGASASGTVTSVATGAGLTGGPITVSGTVALNAASIASLALADSALQNLSALSTSDLSEGTNLYYTEVRVAANSAVALNTAKISYTDAAAVALNTAKVGVTTEISNVVEDTTPQLGGELDAGAHSIGFTMQTATGDGATTIDWKLGNHFDFTFGAFNETFTFTAPTKPGVYTLSLKQDSVGSRTATWPATVKWAGGVAPTLTTTLTTGYDIISFRFDGTNYYGVASLDFS